MVGDKDYRTENVKKKKKKKKNAGGFIMRGIKKVAGMTRQHCEKDGYGMRVQGIYDPVEDKIIGIPQAGGSYLVPADGKITVWFSVPTTMDGVSDAVYNRINELKFMDELVAGGDL